MEFRYVTTRGGDRGEASLYDGSRRSKDHLLFEVIGDLDELSSYLGVVRQELRERDPGGLAEALIDADGEIRWIQEVLGIIMALAGASPGSPQYARLSAVDEKIVQELEFREARLLNETEIEPRFVVPGDGDGSAPVDYARAMCRRCERRLVGLIRSRETPRPDLHSAQHFLNRLSDYLFVLARYVEQRQRE